jgi:hypothetical protein
MMRQVHSELMKQQNHTWNRWDKIQWAVIGVLGSVAGFAVLRLLNL